MVMHDKGGEMNDWEEITVVQVPKPSIKPDRPTDDTQKRSRMVSGVVSRSGQESPLWVTEHSERRRLVAAG